MKTMKLKHVLLLISLALVATGIMFVGCDKSGPNPSDPNNPDPSGKLFKTSDFEVYDIGPNLSSSPHEISVSYKVRNKTTKDYSRDNSDHGMFQVYWKAKGSDGAWYDDDENIQSLNAGASQSDRMTIADAPNNLTLDYSTLTYEIRVD